MNRLGRWVGQALFYQTHDSFWKRYRHHFVNPLFWLFFIGGWWAGIELSRLGVFEYAALRVGDALIREASEKRAVRSERIRIVNITPEDFKDVFKGQLPLSPSKLSSAIQALSNRAPEALIVDLDTSDEVFARMDVADSTGFPIIWARGGSPSPSDPTVLVPQNILGGRSSLPVGSRSGLSVNFPSLDWSIRQYPRLLVTTARSRAESLHWAAFCAIRPGDPRCGDDSSNRMNDLEVPAFQRFVEFDRFPLQEFLSEPLGTQNVKKQRQGVEDPRISGKIVILGGSYSSCDLYKTPFGERSGAEIVASALDQELDGEHPGFMGSDEYLWKILLALAIVAIHTLFRPIPALFATLGILSLLVLQGVWIAFHFVDYRASVVPFLLAIVIEQLGVAAHRAHELAVKAESAEGMLQAAAQNFLILRDGVAELAGQPQAVELAMQAKELANTAERFSREVGDTRAPDVSE